MTRRPQGWGERAARALPPHPPGGSPERRPSPPVLEAYLVSVLSPERVLCHCPERATNRSPCSAPGLRRQYRPHLGALGPPIGWRNWTAGQVGAMLWTAVWQAMNLAVMRTRPIGPVPLFLPGEKASAGPGWHGLARCGGWLRFARRGSGGGSTARAGRQPRREAR
eukprot:scaffold29679_cov39-Phaeocystis_antarctica.AAC.1